MPEAFNKCRKKGGKIRTFSGPNKRFGLGDNEYIHVCFLYGKAYPGEKKRNHTEAAIKAYDKDDQD
jgi:hypothetical protein